MVDPTRLPAGLSTGPSSGLPTGLIGEPTAVEAAEPVAVDLTLLVGQHYRSVYRYAYRLCGNEADAEDLTQQTFLVAQTRLHQIREPDKVDRWLFAVLRSCFLKSLRRPRPTAAANLELDIDGVPERLVSDRSVHEEWLDQEELQLALDELPDEFRLVVLMFYFDECSYQEIAVRLELPIGTVMSRLSRAKGRLRQRLFAGVSAHPERPARKVSLGS